MSQIIKSSSGGGIPGTVTSFSFTNANGFDGVVTNPTTTPNLTLTTSVGDDEVLYASGGAIVGAGPGTAGQVLTSNGAGVAPTFQSVAADGAITTIDGDSGSMTPTAGVVTISGGTTGLTTSASASTMNVTGTLNAGHGGTGLATYTTYELLASGTTATGNFQQIGAGTSTQVLTSNGAGSLPSFQSASASGAITTITGNSGGAESPSSGNFNIVGTGSITVAGSANTETVELTGLTNYNVLTGQGTTTIGTVAPSSTSGVPLISQGSSSQPVFGTALIAGGGTAATSFNINGAVFSNTTTTGALASATLSSGQILIGGTAAPAAATLTAGSGISISNGNHSITVSGTGGGFTWNDTTGGSATLAAQNGYKADSASLTTFTLPTNNALGDTIIIMGSGAGGWKIVYTTSQYIQFGSVATTTTTGNLSSTNQYDCVTLVCISASASAPIFQVLSSIGNPSYV